MAHLAYKFRLFPTATQERALLQQLESLRRVYNAVLDYWNEKSDAWLVANPPVPKPPKTKLTAGERAVLKAKREADNLARKNVPPKKKNHNKTDEQRAEEQSKWLTERYPSLNEAYHFLTKLRDEPKSETDPHRPDPKYLTGKLVVMSTLRDTAERVRKAFRRFWDIQSGLVQIPPSKKPRKDGRPHGYPRFKRRGGLSSISFAQYGSGIKLRDADGHALKSDVPASRHGYRVDVACVGRVRVNSHRAIVGTIKNATVSRDVDGKWYVAFMAELADAVPAPSTLPPVGIDVGLEYFLTTSDGEHVANPRILKSKLKELRRKQRSSSRKMEVAKKCKAKFHERKNLQKSFWVVSKLNVRVRNLRKEQHCQVVNSLVNRYGAICVEDLSIRNMLKNNKLSRAISDVAWGNLLIRLHSKAVKAGVRFVKVDARGTSQTCPQCNGEVRKSLKDRLHECPRCGYTTHRDHASAQVILARGVVGDGAGSVPVAVNPSSSQGLQRNLSACGDGSPMSQ